MRGGYASHDPKPLVLTEQQIADIAALVSGGTVTKSAIEAVLTGEISSHTHAGTISGHESTYNHVNYNTAYGHSQAAHAPTDAVNLSTVKADTDVASAISLKHSNSTDHAPGSDNQDLSGKVDKITNYSLVSDTEIAKIHSNTLDHAAHSDDQNLSGKMDVTAFSGLTKITVGSTPPVAPNVGDLFIDTTI
jgi:hypothetical protein